MNRINAVSPSPNHVTQTSLGRASRAGIAVRAVSVAIVGLTSAPMAAHAQAVSCLVNGPAGPPPIALIPSITAALLVPGSVLSLNENCIYVLTTAQSITNFGSTGLPPITQRLTIKGNGATITRAQSAPSFRIFEVGSGGDLTLSDLIVDNGDAVGGAVVPDKFRKGRGGGIYNLGTLKVINSTLSHNHASVGGGGIGNGDPSDFNPSHPGTVTPGHLTLIDSVLFDNSSDIGAAVANGFTSNMNLTGCTISNNNANTEGGGVATEGTAFMDKCTVSGNTTTNGGAIANGGHLFLTDSPVTGNHAIANNSSGCPFTGLGGGIFNAPAAGSTITLIHSPVTGNEAVAAKSGSGCTSINDTGLGGGIVNAAFNGVFGTASLTDSDVSGNSAASGGGIANVGPMTLTHSNVTGNNSTGDGGGIFNLTDRAPGAKPIAALTLTHSDVTGNNAGTGQPGGGIFNEAGNKVTLNDSSVAGNTPDDF